MLEMGISGECLQTGWCEPINQVLVSRLSQLVLSTQPSLHILYCLHENWEICLASHCTSMFLFNDSRVIDQDPMMCRIHVFRYCIVYCTEFEMYMRIWDPRRTLNEGVQLFVCTGDKMYNWLSDDLWLQWKCIFVVSSGCPGLACNPWLFVFTNLVLSAHVSAACFSPQKIYRNIKHHHIKQNCTHDNFT